MAAMRVPSFGDMLRRYRLAAGFTQEELAERAGLSPKGISDLESGRRRTPRRETLALLAGALNLSEMDRSRFEAAARQRPVLSTPAAEPPAEEGAGRARSASAQVAGPSRPPLVGRVRELALLERHVAGESVPLLTLAGEPGIGKTRLLQEATTLARDQGWTVLEGGCHRRSEQEPYAPLLSALERFISQRSLAQLRADLRGCGWLVRLLPELSEMSVAAPAGWTLSPEQERRLMFSAVGRFFSNVAGPAGTLVVLDDLQWAGVDALDLLAALARAPASQPISLVAAYRDTEVRSQSALAVLLADLAREGLAARLSVGPLSNEEATDLLSRLLPGATDDVSLLRRRVLQRAGGVPFFLVSCAQGLRAGALAGDGHHGDIPWSAAETIRQRVTALPEVAQDLLRIAALVGPVVPRALVLEVATSSGRNEGEVLNALDEACQARLLVEDGESDYRFPHNLIREVVEADLGAARRPLLHRSIAEALEHRPGELPVEALAHHYSRAGMPEKVVEYLERAAERAQSMHANASAESYYRELILRLEELGRSTGRARERLGVVLTAMARYDVALEELGQAEQAFRAAGDPEGTRRTLAHIGWAHALGGTPEQGLARLLPLLAELDECEPSRELAALHVALAHLYGAGRYVEQLAAAERAAALAQAVHDEGQHIQAEDRRASALIQLGRLSEALEVLEAATPRAERRDDLRSLSAMLHNAGVVYEARGELARAGQYYDRALEAAQRMGDPTETVFVMGKRGWNAFYVGDWSRARDDLERAVAMSRQIGLTWAAARPLLALSELRLAEGEAEEAARDLEEARTLAARSRDLWSQRQLERLLAERDLLEGRPQAARERLVPLLDRPGLAERVVTRLLPLVAWAHLELGDPAAAEAPLERAIQRARAEDDRLSLLDALHVRALAASRAERWDEAASALDESLALARAMPFPYAEARALYVYGLLHVARNERDLARRRLEAALAALRRLGERLYAERTERALAALAR